MKDKICGIVRDLLPLYGDKATCEESNMLIEEHLMECEDCLKYKEDIERETYENISEDAEPSMALIQEQECELSFNRIAVKIKKRRKRIMAAVSTLILLLSIIAAGEYVWIKLNTYTISMGTNILTDDTDTEKTEKIISTVNGAAYQFTKPQRGDVVYVSGDKSRGLAGGYRTVIGLPGEKVEVYSETLYINEEIIKIGDSSSYRSISPILLSDNEYYVAYDFGSEYAKEYSATDSRIIKKGDIMGRVEKIEHVIEEAIQHPKRNTRMN